MKFVPFIVGLALVVLMATPQAHAQMFGSRAGGGSLGQGAAKESTGVGTVNFSERFIRGNRRPNAFVGRDLQEGGGFVGREQGGQTRRVQTSIAPIVGSTAPDANRTGSMPRHSRSEPYEPRLSLAFDLTRPPEEAVAQDLTDLLMACPHFQSTSRIVVSVEGATATLRGAVASERDRTLAESLILFEPGIDSVRNELKVLNRPMPPAEYLPTPRPPSAPNLKQKATAPR